MSARVVGIEGAWPLDGPVIAWGAAVILTGGRIVNSLSGQSSPLEDLADLVEAGHIERLPEMRLPTGTSADGLVLVALRSGEVGESFRPDTTLVQPLVKKTSNEGVSLYLFRDSIDFQRYAADRIVNASRSLLTSSLESPKTRPTLRAMLTLRARDPLALAIEAHLDPSLRDFARRILHEEDRDAFDATWRDDAGGIMLRQGAARLWAPIDFLRAVVADHDARDAAAAALAQQPPQPLDRVQDPASHAEG